MLTQMLQLDEFFHKSYIFDSQNSTATAIVARRTSYRARLAPEWGHLRDQTPNKITQQRI